MLPKKNRADKKAVEKIFKTGRFLASPSLNFKFILNSDSNTAAISFIVPKSISKSAVRRNLLRRRGYAALGKYMSRVPGGLSGAFVFKQPEEDVAKLEDEIKGIFNKIN